MPEPDIEIRIGTKAETAGIRETEQAIRSLSEKGKAHLKELVSEVAPSLAAIGSLAGAFEAVKRALEEYANAEAGVRKMQIALAAFGNLTDETNIKLQELAGTLEETTGHAAGEWIDVFTRLLQFGARPEEIDKHVAAVKNLAGILGGDLQQAAALISRALEGNVEAFRRLGVHFDENATKASQLSEIYEQLARMGGGQLEAATESLSGKFAKLRNATNNLFQGIGQIISQSGVVQLAIDKLSAAFDFLSRALNTSIPALDRMRNAQRASAATALEAEQYNRAHAESLKEIHDWAKAAADALDRKLKADEAIRRQQDEMTDAKMAYGLAEVDLLERSGKLNPVQAIAARASIRAQSAREKMAREEAAQVQAAEIARAKKKAILDEIAGLEEAARAAEAQVISESEIPKLRAKVLEKPTADLRFWEGQLAAVTGFGGDVNAYSNPQLGIKAGPKTYEEQAAAIKAVREKYREAKRFHDEAVAKFDREYGQGPAGASGRASRARALAVEATQKAGPIIADLDALIEGSEGAVHSARERYKTQSATLAVQTAAEALGQNPGLNDAALRQMEARILQQSGAFETHMNALTNAITGGFETINRGVMEALAQIERRQREWQAWTRRERNK